MPGSCCAARQSPQCGSHTAFAEHFLRFDECIFNVWPAAVPAGLTERFANFAPAEAGLERIADMAPELPQMTTTREEREQHDQALLCVERRASPDLTVQIAVHNQRGFGKHLMGERCGKFPVGLIAPRPATKLATALHLVVE